MSEELKFHIKRYAKAFVQAFITGVCLTAIPMLNTLDFTNISVSVLIAVFGAGFFSALKLVMEMWLGEFKQYAGYAEYLGSQKKK